MNMTKCVTYILIKFIRFYPFLSSQFKTNICILHFPCLLVCSTPSPLGMASGAIPDASITASSYDPSTIWNREAKYVRLGGHRYWASHSNDLNPWIQVELGRTHVVTGLQTEGMFHNDRHQYWVEQVTVQVLSTKQELVFIEDGNHQPKVQFIAGISSLLYFM